MYNMIMLKVLKITKNSELEVLSFVSVVAANASRVSLKVVKSIFVLQNLVVIKVV